MTYCLGILVDEGLLLMADTRTNAGIDNVSSYKKLHCLADEPQRQIYVTCCGSLSASQSLLGHLLESDDAPAALAEARTMFGVAEIVGQAVRRANAVLFEAVGADKTRGASLLLGGRIGTERPRLFLVYPEGNFIECKRDVPFLQIGETKYGRPILDRVVTGATPLSAAVKIACLSFDSAMRSNLSVARPLDMAVIPAAAPARTLVRRIEKDDPYFNELSRRWSCTLVDAAERMPEPAFMAEFEAQPPLSLVTELRA